MYSTTIRVHFFFLLPSHIESNINFKPKITNNYETL